MAVLRQQSSFEGIEGLAQKATAGVKKAVAATAKAVTADVKQSFTGEVGTGENMGAASGGQAANQVNSQAIQKSQNEASQNLVIWRQNLAEINQKIERVRAQRIKDEQEKNKIKEQEKQQKKQVEAKKKNEEYGLLKMLRGRQGSHEGLKKVGG